ncbi:DUF3796 domain-containing protein [Sporosarcina limicola]|uniref:Nicotinamide riboside transporter PnuC n=1 Tax=Sporosarcina limicola TaxID=34101 RepID=A0A927MHU2_9BACL|nr:DUF3796 domain-containing protein [Sporosarcina limicola]MBE1554915.1 nicotinamide riboside transporter PnuC [Sporosarcina limicola]
MREDFDLLAFLLGLPLGLVITLSIGYFVWKRGKRQRRYDERYKRIQEQARSLSWAVTIFTLVIAWAIIIIIEGASLSFFLISGVYVLAMITYGIGAAIADKKN